MDDRRPALRLRIKRIVDVIGALAGLLIFAPLFLGVAAVIVLVEGRPMLHHEQRVGRGGRLFSLIKFRTLRMDSDGLTVVPDDDPRLTRTGLWLRRWRLNEFPQLVNVLKGDMSLVGPRPKPPAHIAALPEAVRAELLSMRPGLTDPAAIHFLAEDAVLAGHPDAETLYLTKILPAKVKMHIEYIRSWTLLKDLGVVARTFRQLWSPAQRRRSARMVARIIQ